MNRDAEYYFARYCGVAMAGLKPASLVQYPRRRVRGARRLMRALSDKGICFRVLRARHAKLVLVYREAVLARHLRREENRPFLLEAGYPDGGVDCMLGYLERRLKEDEFPHEIGIFLGYPIEDVLGFIANPDGCEYCGMWKVYGRVEEKKELFDSYKMYTDSLTAKVTGGQSLVSVFSYGGRIALTEV